ncbi:MAG: hypothetical protein ABJD11_12095 [Gemmatimonadota bacterium]
MFTVIDLGGLAVVGYVIGRVLTPIAGALGRRMEGQAVIASDSDPVVQELRGELDQLQERVDFLERAIASGKSSAELPPMRTPV